MMTVEEKQQRLREAGWCRSGPGHWIEPGTFRVTVFQTAWAIYRTNLQLKGEE